MNECVGGGQFPIQSLSCKDKVTRVRCLELCENSTRIKLKWNQVSPPARLRDQKQFTLTDDY